MNLERLPETNLEKGLTYYGDSLTLFGEMVEGFSPTDPTQGLRTKAPRQILPSPIRLGIALPSGSVAAPTQGLQGAATAYPKGVLDVCD